MPDRAVSLDELTQRFVRSASDNFLVLDGDPSQASADVAAALRAAGRRVVTIDATGMDSLAFCLALKAAVCQVLEIEDPDPADTGG